MDFELWQIPLLVGAGIVALAYLATWIVRLRGRRLVPQRTGALRTVVLAAVSVVLLGLLVVAVQAVGTSVAANLVAIASLILEAAALRWTYLSYRATKDLNRTPAPPR